MPVGGTNLKGIVIGIIAILLFLSVAIGIMENVSAVAENGTTLFSSGLANTVMSFIGVAFGIGLLVYLFSWFRG